MRRARKLVRAVLLTAAAVSALAGLTIAEAAAWHSPSPGLASSALVLRGATDSPEQVAAASDSAPPTVLRAVHRHRRRSRVPPLMPAIQASTTMRTMAVCCRATPTPPITDTGPITGTGPASDSAGSTTAAGAAGSATALPTALAEDKRFALVTPSPITALVTASPMPAGSADASVPKMVYLD
jgi:hypothetical protein